MALWKNKAAEVVSMLWSPLPLSVTLLCGHSQAWFGYACRMRRAGKNPVWWMWRSNMHGHTHTEWFLFKKMHFYHGCCRITHDRERGHQKKEYGTIWSMFLLIFFFLFLLNVYLHAMHEREEETWIIVHGCMGDKSHLMCSYFWGHREFGFTFSF